MSNNGCPGQLTWVDGEDGFESTCFVCGKVRLGMLEDPSLYRTCASCKDMDEYYEAYTKNVTSPYKY